MTDTPDRLVERLNNEGQKTVEFFRTLQPADWQRTVYADGAHWTVHQLLAHFVSTEASIARLIENILAGGEGSPEDFDIDAFNETKAASLAQVPSADLLKQFAALRQASADLVGAMNTGNLQKMGRHPWLGVTSIEEIVKLLYRHNQIHQRDVRKLLEADSA